MKWWATGFCEADQLREVELQVLPSVINSGFSKVWTRACIVNSLVIGFLSSVIKTKCQQKKLNEMLISNVKNPGSATAVVHKWGPYNILGGGPHSKIINWGSSIGVLKTICFRCCVLVWVARNVVGMFRLIFYIV